MIVVSVHSIEIIILNLSSLLICRLKTSCRGRHGVLEWIVEFLTIRIDLGGRGHSVTLWRWRHLILINLTLVVEWLLPSLVLIHLVVLHEWLLLLIAFVVRPIVGVHHVAIIVVVNPLLVLIVVIPIATLHVVAHVSRLHARAHALLVLSLLEIVTHDII